MHGSLQTWWNVVETNVSQSAGSKASLALVGRMVPSQERSRALGVVGLLQAGHLHSENGVLYCCLGALRQVELVLLLEARAGIALPLAARKKGGCSSCNSFVQCTIVACPCVCVCAWWSAVGRAELLQRKLVHVRTGRTRA